MKRLITSLAMALPLVTAAPSFAEIHRSDLPVVQTIADQLENASRNVQDHAHRQSLNFDPREFRMMQTLDRFHESATRLDRMLDRYFANREDADMELRAMNRDAQRIKETLYRSNEMIPAIHEWERAERMLSEINRYVYSDERLGSLHWRDGDPRWRGYNRFE